MAVFPSVDLTDFDVASAVERVKSTGDSVTATTTEIVRNSAYTAVGLGILAYQRVQVRRRELERELRR
jgi:hypothetical protein